MVDCEKLATQQIDLQYQQYVSQLPINDIPQKIGLNNEDYIQSISHEDTISIDVVDSSSSRLTIPVITSLDIFPWYNRDLISKSLPGYSVKYIPTLPEGLSHNDQEKVNDTIISSLNAGDALVVDVDLSNPDDRFRPLQTVSDMAGIKICIDNLGGGEDERYLNQYIARVTFQNEHTDSRSLFACYEDMVQEGILENNSQNGPSLALSIKESEINSIWRMYKDRFDVLSENHPVNAGYNEIEFKNILRDPSVVKVVNRVDGEVTTVCLFLTDLYQCTWLNRQYFYENYSSTIQKNNLLVFLGIVTDERKQGNAYATDVVDLLVRVADEKSEPTVITFECNEISQNVTPILVKSAIENSGLGIVEGLDRQVSQIGFYVIRKATNS